jgi:hypothetical protein
MAAERRRVGGLQVLFPFMSMLGVHTADGTLGGLLWGLQLPAYTRSVAYARDATWKGVALLVILVVHALAASIAVTV